LDQIELLRYTIEILETQGIDYMIVGSFASTAYGEPRLTLGIDVVLQLAGEQVERLIDAFPDPEFYVSDSAAREAVAERGQFNVIHPSSGNKVDFMVARNDAWGQSQLARRVRKLILADLEANVAAAEDVVLGKLLYYHEGGSDKHLRDIAGMLQVSGEEIDRGYIARWAEQLGVMQPWRAVLERLG
jgi:hypothetical protein